MNHPPPAVMVNWLRRNLHVTQPELAEMLDVSTHSIWRWEKLGVAPRPGHMRALIGLYNRAQAGQV